MRKKLIVAVSISVVIVLCTGFSITGAAAQTEDVWTLSAQFKDDATFYEPVTVSGGGGGYRPVKISTMKDVPRDSLVITRISPIACSVVLNGKEGKMFLKDITIDPQSLQGAKGYIFGPTGERDHGQGLSVYETADADSRVAMILYGDFAKVVIDEYGEEWCRVKLGENAGYVPTSCIGVGYPDTGDDIGWFYEAK